MLLILCLLLLPVPGVSGISGDSRFPGLQIPGLRHLVSPPFLRCALDLDLCALNFMLVGVLLAQSAFLVFHRSFAAITAVLLQTCLQPTHFFAHYSATTPLFQ